MIFASSKLVIIFAGCLRSGCSFESKGVIAGNIEPEIEGRIDDLGITKTSISGFSSVFLDHILTTSKQLFCVPIKQSVMELENAIKDRDDTVSNLQQQMSQYENDHKEKELDLQILRGENKRLKLQYLDVSNFLQWKHDEICQWIIGLDHGRLLKYEEKLRFSLDEEEVDGQILEIVDGGDLKRWGVTKLADIKFLQKELLNLVNNAPGKDHGCGDQEGANAAITVHH